MRKENIHLFGHVHLTPDKKLMPGKSIDVGLDGNNMKPYELKEIIHILKDRPVRTNILPYDHHEN